MPIDSNKCMDAGSPPCSPDTPKTTLGFEARARSIQILISSPTPSAEKKFSKVSALVYLYLLYNVSI
jgi:hypothetical protein